MNEKMWKILHGETVIVSSEWLDENRKDLPEDCVSIPNPKRMGVMDAFLLGRIFSPEIAAFRKEMGLFEKDDFYPAIVLNGKKFIHTSKPGSRTDIAGYYKPFKKQITLLNLGKNKIGVITTNRVLLHARKIENKYWYSFSTIPVIGEYASYSQQVSEVDTALLLARIS